MIILPAETSKIKIMLKKPLGCVPCLKFSEFGVHLTSAFCCVMHEINADQHSCLLIAEIVFLFELRGRNRWPDVVMYMASLALPLFRGRLSPSWLDPPSGPDPLLGWTPSLPHWSRHLLWCQTPPPGLMPKNCSENKYALSVRITLSLFLGNN